MLKPVETRKDHWFFGPILACKSVYVQVICASVLINLFALASSLYIMTVYDRVVPNNAIHSLWWLTDMIAVVILSDLAMKILRGIFVDTASARVDKQVSAALFERIARHDATLSRNATGSLASTVRNFDILKDVIGSASFTVFADLPFIILFLFVLYAIGGPVAAVPALIVPVVILFGLALQPIIKRMSELAQSQGKSKQAVIVEMIAALDTVKTVQGISMLRNRWLNSVIHQSQSTTKTKLTSQLAAQFAQFGQQVSQIGIVVYGVFLIADGNLTMGQLIACVILSGRTMAPLVEAGHEPRSSLLAARTRYQQAIGSAELARLAAEARKSDLQGKQREMESLTANFKAEAAAQLVEAKTKAAQYLSRQEALRGKVRHAEIRAPLSGTVSAVHVKTIGAVVQAGTVLVDIVPAESVLLARAQVLPQHVAAVRPGQIARLSVSAYDPSRYGVLMGIVQRVATNTTQPENQMPYYETIIEIPEVRLTKSGIQPEITPGMPLTVDILGDKRTVMNYIITPIEKSWKSAFREQ
jgi:HlyD family type I secretion membrane fusion protein